MKKVINATCLFFAFTLIYLMECEEEESFFGGTIMPAVNSIIISTGEVGSPDYGTSKVIFTIEGNDILCDRILLVKY